MTVYATDIAPSAKAYWQRYDLNTTSRGSTAGRFSLRRVSRDQAEGPEQLSAAGRLLSGWVSRLVVEIVLTSTGSALFGNGFLDVRHDAGMS